MRTKQRILLSDQNHKMYWYLTVLTCVVGFSFQGWRTLFNNFAVDEVGINAFQVGAIQSLREVPGFLSLLVVYLLLIFKEHRLSALSVFVLGVGVAAAGFLGSFWGLVFTTFAMSVGMHYFETTRKSLILQYFSRQQAPLAFARLLSWTAVVNICVGGVILGLQYVMDIPAIFCVIGAVAILVGLGALFVNPTSKHIPKQNNKMVFKKKYWLFYVINFLSGARRQIFVVFAVFILVQRHHYSVAYVTALFILNNIISYFVAPIIGRMINKYSERAVLSMEYGWMVFIFLGYAFIDNAWIVGILYIIDNIFYPCSMAINTYFQKIGEPEDIAPSMAVGFTINHISAVVIPVMGGALWLLDYRIPFVVGAMLSVCSLYFVQKMKVYHVES